MLVIGIDPGTAICGYGLVSENEEGEISAVDWGAILTPAKTPEPERLAQIYSSLQEILQQHQPDSAAVEDLFFQRNVRTAMSVGQARGVALLALEQAGLPISEYKPNEIKQTVSGYGAADKQQMQRMVQALLKLDELPKPDDAADALAVAICHLQHRKFAQITQQGL